VRARRNIHGKNCRDYLCERLIEWGVDTIYGFPGDGINGILGALRRHEDQLRFIQTRHEEMASFMACGHAKFTGDVGSAWPPRDRGRSTC